MATFHELHVSHQPIYRLGRNLRIESVGLCVDATVGVNKGRDAGVNGAHQIRSHFDSAIDRKREVLPRFGGIAKPRVIGDVHEKVWLVDGKLATEVG